jgi:iturin family lipopeptide synthetase A
VKRIAGKLMETIASGDIGKEVGVELLAALKQDEAKPVDAIAIIGMAVRFPGADNIEEFWRNIESGKDCIIEFPESRHRDIEPFFERLNIDRNRASYAKGGYIRDIDKFDCKFFHLSPKEANLMDPNQRIFLETAWRAIQDSGYNRSKLSGSNTGVYVGFNSQPIYSHFITESDTASKSISTSGNVPSIVAGRIAYFFDLKGPSMIVDTACSSALVAIHLACQGLRNGDCRQAIAGGVKIALAPLENKVQVGIESPDYCTRAFDEAANGTVWGEGAVAIVLKPLKKAFEDNDRIYAVIKGTAVNQDGASLGITAPNALAQANVIAQAWENAGINPETISYIETHGTATHLGDPVEIEGLDRAFRKYTSKSQFCAIGSLKPNIGHLDSVAGAAGLIKAVLALQQQKIPPTLYFNTPNCRIDFLNSPLYVNDRPVLWESNGQPRRCGVSAFGFAGTNCHVVLEEYPEPSQEPVPKHPHIFTLSANSKNGLEALVKEYATFLKTLSNDTVGNLCYTANLVQDYEKFRLAVIINNSQDLSAKLQKLCDNDWSGLRSDGIYYGVPTGKENCQPDITPTSNQLIRHYLETSGNEVAKAEILAKLAKLFVLGASVDWNELYLHEKWRKTKIPEYPLERKRCWVNPPAEHLAAAALQWDYHRNPVDISSIGDEVGMLAKQGPQHRIFPHQKDGIIKELTIIFENTLEMEPGEIDPRTGFFEIGVDSILLVQIAQGILDKYNIEIPFSSFFEKITNLDELADYILDKINRADYKNPEGLRSLNPPNSPSLPQALPAVSHEMLRGIEQQLQNLSKQLQILKSNSFTKDDSEKYQAVEKGSWERLPNREEKSIEKGSGDTYLPYRKIELSSKDSMSESQTAYLTKLIRRHNQRTQASKDLTQKYRFQLANNRNVAGFKPNWKEMIYQITVNRASGSRIWDTGGQEFIDLTMGFGACLFGHNAPFIREKIEAELHNGASIGPMSHLAGEVAQLICELTGVERVAFFNSGTEAVMVALRLARVATGRSKIVIFAGSYHGTYDGVLARRHTATREVQSVPLAPGIPQSLISDTYVLDYGTSESMAFIKAHAQELAAVLVEPVQSRRPDFQPREFLQELRAATQNNGATLIFDEVITGFRIHPGGAQAWFGIRADLVTYGKIVGGTMPIGIVAGKADFMDGIDGGTWRYGDLSVPPHDDRRTFVAGTFCHHPLAMAASLAALEELKKQGPGLQERLNARTNQLCERLNRYYLENDLPIKMVYFGSLFRFNLRGDGELLFYSLLEKGIYVWEGRNCFLATAHTHEDLEYVIRAVKESAAELRQAGFFIGKTPTVNTLDGTDRDHAIEAMIPVTDEQKQLWFLSQTGKETVAAFNQAVVLKLRGRIHFEALRDSIQGLVDRHEALRTVFDPDGEYQKVLTRLQVELPLQDFSGFAEHERWERTEQWLKDEEEKAFDFAKGPLFRLALIKQNESEYCIVIIVHHLVADGWSIDLLMKELTTLYNSKCQGLPCTLPKPVQYREYVAWTRQESEARTQAENYWWKRFQQPAPWLELPTVQRRTIQKSYRGNRQFVVIEAPVYQQLKKLCSKYQCTVYMLLLAGFNVLLHRLTGLEDLVVGIPTAGQAVMKAQNLVGQCVNILPIRSSVHDGLSFADYLKQIKIILLEAYEHQTFSFSKLGRAESNRGVQLYQINVMFNMDRPLNPPRFAELDTQVIPFPIHYVQNDLDINIVESGRQLKIDYDYQTDLYDDATVECWMNYYLNLLDGVIANPVASIASLPLLSLDEQNAMIDSWNFK